jgi:hypothetical protein
LTLLTFVLVYSSKGRAQAEFAWFLFDDIDWPAVPLAFVWFGSSAPMSLLMDWGYDLVGSGPNLRALVLVGFAGGIQWLILGGTLGAGLDAFRNRATPKHAFRDQLPSRARGLPANKEVQYEAQSGFH